LYESRTKRELGESGTTRLGESEETTGEGERLRHHLGAGGGERLLVSLKFPSSVATNQSQVSRHGSRSRRYSAREGTKSKSPIAHISRSTLLSRLLNFEVDGQIACLHYKFRANTAPFFR
jgi:hypothetical protein